MPPRFHLLTGPPTLDAASLERVLHVLRAAAAGDGPGVDAVQVRAKRARDREVVDWTRALVAATRGTTTRVIVNDRLDLALAAGADGVHLGREDLAVADARALVEPGFLIGATCRGPEHAVEARRDGADYVGVGPVHASTTKPELTCVIGHGVLAAAARETWTIAIGGITAERVPDALAAGAHGVAVASAVWDDADPPRVAQEIAELVHAR